MVRTTVLVTVFALAAGGTTLAQGSGPQRADPLTRPLSITSVRRALSPIRFGSVSPMAAPAVARKMSHPVATGALLGGVAGLIIGKVGADDEVRNCPAGRSCSTAGVGILLGLIAGAGIGALLGWIVGRFR